MVIREEMSETKRLPALPTDNKLDIFAIITYKIITFEAEFYWILKTRGTFIQISALKPGIFEHVCERGHDS
jgi:hypothetical protein